MIRWSVINNFPSNCDLATNLLFSLNFLKGFQDYFQDTEKKVIENIVLVKNGNFNFWALLKM